MDHCMMLHDRPFEMIKRGIKTVEMRLHDKKRQAVNVGDLIMFTNVRTGEKMTVRVIAKNIFDNFEALYDFYEKSVIGYLPDEVSDPDDMAQYYCQDDIKEFGVCAMEIRVEGGRDEE